MASSPILRGTSCRAGRVSNRWRSKCLVRHAGGVGEKLPGVEDRDAAVVLPGCDVAVEAEKAVEASSGQRVRQGDGFLDYLAVGGVSSRYITIGKVAGLFGVSGWVKVHSYTSPRHDIVSYSLWHLSGGSGFEPPAFEMSRRHGKGVIAKFLGIDDRDAAVALLGCDVAIEATQLKS